MWLGRWKLHVRPLIVLEHIAALPSVLTSWSSVDPLLVLGVVFVFVFGFCGKKQLNKCKQ